MAMCAGVQNVSRPIVRCHEMSQITPTPVLVAASNTAVRYQGTGAVVAGRGEAVAVMRRSSGGRAKVRSSCSASLRLDHVGFHGVVLGQAQPVGVGGRLEVARFHPLPELAVVVPAGEGRGVLLR